MILILKLIISEEKAEKEITELSVHSFIDSLVCQIAELPPSKKVGGPYQRCSLDPLIARKVARNRLRDYELRSFKILY